MARVGGSLSPEVPFSILNMRFTLKYHLVYMRSVLFIFITYLLQNIIFFVHLSSFHIARARKAPRSVRVCVCVYGRVRMKMGIYINSPSSPIYLRAYVCVCVRPLLYLFYTHIFRVVSIPSMLCDFITSAAIHTDPNFILREC